MTTKGNRSSRARVSPLRSHIGYWMRVVSNSVSQAFARKLEATGVTVAEWVVLREMYEGVDKGTSPSAVAGLTGLTRGAVSKLIDRLLEKRLVIRSEAQEDRRFQDIRLTPAAIALVPKLARLADQNDEEFFDALSSAERIKLFKLLKTVAEHHALTKAAIE